MKAIFKSAWPYKQDKMHLPVNDVETALSFYQNILGFQVVSRQEAPLKSAVLRRDEIQIGLAENGGDPSQEGCFFEVDDVQAALAELKSRGLEKKGPDSISTEKHGETSWKVFYVVAPDGLCYCLGERQTAND